MTLITKKRRVHLWLILFGGLLALFLLLQVPAAWLLKKFAPTQQQLHNVSGNIWQGRADWRMGNVHGTLNWRTRPWELLRLRLASDVQLQSGQTRLQGIASAGIGKRYQMRDWNGKISPETLTAMLPWQWPAASINVRDLALAYRATQGITDAAGQLSWAGGMLNYPMGQRLERIDIPPLLGNLSLQKDKLTLLVTDGRKQRMAELGLDRDRMLDVQLTQRFLMHAPAYQGKAGLDSAVITLRQPVSSIRNL